jgi:Dolichyl-phosphate-mannose-protein mannosyltransferase
MNRLSNPFVSVPLVILGLLGYHLCLTHSSEPFFNNDESRHILTGVFFADVYRDIGELAKNPKQYVVGYYCQYPAIGLLTWPPLFYALEGVAMSVFGPHFWVGRWCVALMSAWSCVSVYRLSRQHFSHWLSLLAMVLVAFTPLVFTFSQRVMLEVPCFAYVMATLFRFEQFLKFRDRRSALLAWVWAAAAMLTRFDGLFVLLYFLLRVLHERGWWIFARWPVWVGAVLGLGAVVPYYLFTFVVYKQGLGQSTQTAELGFLSRLWFYPGTLFEQTGPMLAIVGLAGVCLWKRLPRWPLSLVASVYVFFTLQSEVEPRHAIYWVPAFALLAVSFVQWLFERDEQRAAYSVAVLLIFLGGWVCYWQAYRYVRGYDAAVRWMLTNRTTERPLMMDGEYTASFVYHLRKNDPSRTVWAIRGDKLLYTMFSDPAVQYVQKAGDEAEVLRLLHDADPEFILIEDPPPGFHVVPGSELLRQTLKNHSALFVQQYSELVQSNYDKFTDPSTRLVVYRKLIRNPNPKPMQIDVFGLGGSLEAPK